MTAPTQPPDPRVSKVADAVKEWKYAKVSHESDKQLARVLVEELGGREGETAKDLPSWYRLTWDKITDALTSIDPEWYHSRKDIGTHAADTIRTLAAQQRENAETIAALKGELKLARADRDFWKKRADKAEAEAATLRAELDAIKGAQVPFTYATVYEGSDTLRRVPLYKHPAPALPVVGACVVKPNGDMFAFGHWPQERNEKNAVGYARECGGVAYRTYRDVTPLPTEGGK